MVCIKQVTTLLVVLPLCFGAKTKECFKYDVSAEEAAQYECDDFIFKQKDFKLTLKQDCTVAATDSSKENVKGTCTLNLPWNMFPCTKKSFQIKSGTVEVDVQNKFDIFGKYGINCNIEKECVPKKSRIVNGNVTTALEHPYFVTLVQAGAKDTEASCGGSLITDQIVLTAAHCLTPFGNNYDAIRVVSEEFVDCETKYNSFKIEKWIPHEKYDSLLVHNDIGLIKLAKPITPSSSTSVIERYKSSTIFPAGESVVVTGWGLESFGGVSTQTVQDVELQTISNDDCRTRYAGNSDLLVEQDSICTFTPGKDACKGDSGGPMVTYKDGKRYQVGVVTAGKDCAKYPGIFARVNYFNTWIDNNMKLL